MAADDAMKKIVYGKLYDTETATCLLNHGWQSRHPNKSSDTLDHQRGLYRTKKGALFGHTYDEIGYARDDNGVSGLFGHIHADLIPFADAAAALRWCEYEDVFDANEIMKQLAEVVEEA
jgi:hypothetical protein